MRKLDFDKLFNSKNFLIPFSIVVAIIIWFLVSTVIDPNTTYVVHNVPVDMALDSTVAKTNGLDIVNSDTVLVDIQVTGKSYKVGRLTADDFHAYVDASKVTQPGVYDLEVLVSKVANDDDYEVDFSKTKTLSLEFDYFSEKTFTIEISTPNKTVSDGYIIDQKIVSPDEITIYGRSATIDAISRCVVENSDSLDIAQTTVVEGTLLLYDADANLISLDSLKLSQDEFKITIPLYKKSNLPLTVEFINVPDGVDAKELEYTLSETEIQVGIPVDATSEVESISAGQIDFRNIDIGSSFTFDVSLLAGYLNLDNFTQVTVSFPAEKDGMASTSLSSSNIVLKNAPTNYDISLVTTRLSDIKFVGKADVIAALTSEDVVVTVDFENQVITEGSQRVSASISLLDKEMAWAVGEYSVTVTASSK